MEKKCIYEGSIIPTCDYSKECPYKSPNESIFWEGDPIGPTCNRKNNQIPLLMNQPLSSELERILRIVN